jgi:hypothetical protein
MQAGSRGTHKPLFRSSNLPILKGIPTVKHQPRKANFIHSAENRKAETEYYHENVS